MKNNVLKSRHQFLILSFIMFFAVSDSAVASVALFESFDSVLLCGKPEGWTVNNFGVDEGWYFNEGLQFNETGAGGCYAFAKSDEQPQYMDTVLVTPSINCSAASCEMLSFRHYTRADKSETIFTVEISTDEGGAWSEIWRKEHEGDTNDRKQIEFIDIKAIANDQPNVQLRFHYTAFNDWEWQVDDVKVASKFNWVLFLPAIIAKTNL